MTNIATRQPAEGGLTGHRVEPLSKLVPWDGNVRRTGAAEGPEELTASIAAHGMLQSLVVRKGGRGKFAVVARPKALPRGLGSRGGWDRCGRHPGAVPGA